MHRTARQAAIMKELGSHGSCTVTDLAGRLAVSGETIRRDIKAMADRGLVERVHGGAVSPNLFSEPGFYKRLDRQAAAKKAIARIAAGQVRDGESVMLDTGSTTAYVARALADRNDLLVVTNCAEIARTLAINERNKVYVAGGEFRADDTAIFGPSAIQFVERFRVRHAILSIGAITADDGFMDFHLNEAEFSRAVMARANRVTVVADHSKFTTHAPVKVCGYAEIQFVITDRPPPPAIAERFAEAGTKVVVAQ